MRIDGFVICENNKMMNICNKLEKGRQQMGAFEESFSKASETIEYTIYRCTDFNAGKFFDVPATNKYFGD